MAKKNINGRIQRPSDGYDWLYEDRGVNDRYFTTIVFLADGADPWPECTDAEKQQWEEEHKPEQQPEEAQVVE